MVCFHGIALWKHQMILLVMFTYVDITFRINTTFSTWIDDIFGCFVVSYKLVPHPMDGFPANILVLLCWQPPVVPWMVVSYLLFFGGVAVELGYVIGYCGSSPYENKGCVVSSHLFWVTYDSSAVLLMLLLHFHTLPNLIKPNSDNFQLFFTYKC